MSMYSREVINELNALSKEVFGTTSKWKKMIEKGVPELMQEDTKKLTIKDGKQETETVKTPVLYTGPSGEAELHQHALKRYTVDEVREFMLMVLDRRQQMKLALAQLEAQQKAEAAAKQVALKASGSSVPTGGNG